MKKKIFNFIQLNKYKNIIKFNNLKSKKSLNINKNKTSLLLLVTIIFNLIVTTSINANTDISNISNSNISKLDLFPKSEFTYSSSNQYDSVSDGDIERILNDLCSDNFKGRITGSKENLLTEEYIKDFFLNLDISPFTEDNYFLDIKFRNDFKIQPRNVAAIIKGNSDINNAVFITAHLDHIASKNKEPLVGAIDNASGISVLLETADKLKEASKLKDFDMDIIFVAFNAEELGLIGSKAFISEFGSKYDKFYNINIDCVGQKTCSYLAMGNKHELSEPLYKAMRNFFDKESVMYNDTVYGSKNGLQYGTSDHRIFQLNNNPALCLGDADISGVVHTEKDNLDNIDYSDLSKISDTLSKFIIEYNGEMFY